MERYRISLENAG